MTKICNTASRKIIRRQRALERLTASLSSGVRYRGRTREVLHDADSRAEAHREADKLVLRIAALELLRNLRTKKDRSGRIRYSS